MKDNTPSPYVKELRRKEAVRRKRLQELKRKGKRQKKDLKPKQSYQREKIKLPITSIEDILLEEEEQDDKKG